MRQMQMQQNVNNNNKNHLFPVFNDPETNLNVFNERNPTMTLPYMNMQPIITNIATNQNTLALHSDRRFDDEQKRDVCDEEMTSKDQRGGREQKNNKLEEFKKPNMNKMEKSDKKERKKKNESRTSFSSSSTCSFPTTALNNVSQRNKENQLFPPKFIGEKMIDNDTVNSNGFVVKNGGGDQQSHQNENHTFEFSLNDMLQISENGDNFFTFESEN